MMRQETVDEPLKIGAEVRVEVVVGDVCLTSQQVVSELDVVYAFAAPVAHALDRAVREMKAELVERGLA
jgi:hypothetical protein